MLEIPVSQPASSLMAIHRTSSSMRSNVSTIQWMSIDETPSPLKKGIRVRIAHPDRNSNGCLVDTDWRRKAEVMKYRKGESCCLHQFYWISPNTSHFQSTEFRTLFYERISYLGLVKPATIPYTFDRMYLYFKCYVQWSLREFWIKIDKVLNIYILSRRFNIKFLEAFFVCNEKSGAKMCL